MRMAGFGRQLLQTIFLICAVLLPASFLYGGEGQPGSIVEQVPISAVVNKYAIVSVITQPMNFGNFTGEPNMEIGPRDNAVFKVETNTPLIVKFSGTDLAKNNSKINTAYIANNANSGNTIGFFNRRYSDYFYVGDLTTNQSGLTEVKYEIIGWAKTGPNVSSQEAGQYTATITLTVMAVQ